MHLKAEFHNTCIKYANPSAYNTFTSARTASAWCRANMFTDAFANWHLHILRRFITSAVQITAVSRLVSTGSGAGFEHNTWMGNMVFHVSLRRNNTLRSCMICTHSHKKLPAVPATDILCMPHTWLSRQKQHRWHLLKSYLQGDAVVNCIYYAVALHVRSQLALICTHVCLRCTSWHAKQSSDHLACMCKL